MVGVYTIEGEIKLDTSKFQSSITNVSKKLQQLGESFVIDETTLGTAEESMMALRDIISMVSKEAKSISQAFADIKGISSLLQNLEIIQNKLDKINSSFRKQQESMGAIVKEQETLLGLTERQTTAVQNIGSQNRKVRSDLERQRKEMQGLLSVHDGVTQYLVNEEQITRMSLRILQEQEMVEKEKLAQKERDLAVTRDLFNLQERTISALGSEITVVTDILAMNDEELALLREQLSLEERKLGVQKQQTGEIGKQNAERMATPKGNQLDSMSYLPRRIGSMALTMWGFNELMDVYDKTMGHINAESQKNYFADRLNMSAKQLNNYNKQLADYQKQYQKLDMTVVGANALETASKYKVENKSLGDLTEVMAIYGSEFVKQGRSQEDSILAINDALDGELRRLKEVGIGAEELKATGLWNGDESDKSGMLLALLEIARERGYDKTAKDITNLSDAITQLEVKLSIDLARAFQTIEPLLRDVMKNFVIMLEALEKAIGYVTPKITDFAKAIGLIDKDGNATKFGNFLESWVSWLITFGITAYGVYKIAKPLLGMFGKLKDVTGGIGKGAEDVATTGGTVAKDIEKGGFQSEFKKLGRNLGIMARVFIEVAIGLVMAWALMEEAMILIARIGDDYEKMKPSFDKGAKFLKDYGIYILAVGGAMAVLLQYTDKLPQTDWKSQAKAFGKLMIGLAEAMVLIGEAITLLIIPLGAIALLGWMSDQLDPNMIQKGNEVIGMYADALDYIASNDNIGYFIIGLTVASAVLGFTADTVGVAMAIGIASALLLVSEAIVMLIAPLVAIEMLGYMANELDANAVKQGANAIKTVGDCLQILEPAVRNILAIDFEVFGIGLVEKGNQIVNGKDGFKALTEDILPNLFQFVKDVSNLEVPSEDVSSTVATITQIANSFAPMVTAIQKLTGLLGGDVSISFMGFQIESNSGIRGQLDRLYEDISAVMDFANKLGNLKTVDQVGTTAITQTADAISQLKAKLDQFVNTISSYSNKVQTASDRLGKSLPNGFKSGASTFSATVVQVLASGISEVQARYPTMSNGGKALGQKLVDGFKNHKPTLKTITSREISYALTELDNAKDDFYTKGKALGSELTRGYEDGADIHSPGLIARTTARELRYTMDALTVGERMMYQGGVALGQALTNGYNSYGNLKTDVGVLASKGINSEQLQANATSVQANTKGKGQTQQSLTPTINIDMSNSTIIGIQDLNTRIQNAVETAIVKMNSPNGATGY